MVILFAQVQELFKATDYLDLNRENTLSQVGTR